MGWAKKGRMGRCSEYRVLDGQEEKVDLSTAGQR
jgi:hypothetical protein